MWASWLWCGQTWIIFLVIPVRQNDSNVWKGFQTMIGIVGGCYCYALKYAFETDSLMYAHVYNTLYGGVCVCDCLTRGRWKIWYWFLWYHFIQWSMHSVYIVHKSVLITYTYISVQSSVVKVRMYIRTYIRTTKRVSSINKMSWFHIFG